MSFPILKRNLPFQVMDLNELVLQAMEAPAGEAVKP